MPATRAPLYGLGLLFFALLVLPGCASESADAQPDPAPTTTAPSSEFSSERIDIGVVVTDLERSMEFYTNVLGMTHTGGFDLDEDISRRTGLTGGTPVSIAVLKLQDSENATQWKLMRFGTTADRPANTHIQDDIGMQYTTIFVTALQPFLDRLEANNIPLLGDTPIQLEENRHFVLIQDPDGIFIELIGPMSNQ